MIFIEFCGHAGHKNTKKACGQNVRRLLNTCVFIHYPDSKKGTPSSPYV